MLYRSLSELVRYHFEANHCCHITIGIHCHFNRICLWARSYPSSHQFCRNSSLRRSRRILALTRVFCSCRATCLSRRASCIFFLRGRCCTLLLVLLAFFSTLLVDAFSDEEAVFYPLHHNHRELDQIEAATRTAALQRKIDFFIRSPLYLYDSHYTLIITKIKFFVIIVIFL